MIKPVKSAVSFKESGGGAAVQQDVLESGSPVDSTGAVVACAVVADVVFGAQ